LQSGPVTILKERHVRQAGREKETNLRRGKVYSTREEVVLRPRGRGDRIQGGRERKRLTTGEAIFEERIQSRREIKAQNRYRAYGGCRGKTPKKKKRREKKAPPLRKQGTDRSQGLGAGGGVCHVFSPARIRRVQLPCKGGRNDGGGKLL